jgi:hypothetical protein
MSETRILIRLLRKYFARNWEFSSGLSKLRNFGEGVEPPTPLGTPLFSIVVNCWDVFFSKTNRKAGSPIRHMATAIQLIQQKLLLGGNRKCWQTEKRGIAWYSCSMESTVNLRQRQMCGGVTEKWTLQNVSFTANCSYTKQARLSCLVPN